jgi:hypothetical protein
LDAVAFFTGPFVTVAFVAGAVSPLSAADFLAAVALLVPEGLEAPLAADAGVFVAAGFEAVLVAATFFAGALVAVAFAVDDLCAVCLVAGLGFFGATIFRASSRRGERRTLPGS